MKVKTFFLCCLCIYIFWLFNLFFDFLSILWKETNWKSIERTHIPFGCWKTFKILLLVCGIWEFPIWCHFYFIFFLSRKNSIDLGDFSRHFFKNEGSNPRIFHLRNTFKMKVPMLCPFFLFWELEAFILSIFVSFSCQSTGLKSEAWIKYRLDNINEYKITSHLRVPIT